ncbi:DUF4037 domain-containing protein [Streptomonospora litoralis]|uniref:DUF4037 domain-containing protein n=1 Tax=Streptomonospora litoralis TaxID=2498135 RepID=A0A4P6Q0S6_9ACTN|nr:DUF4037 domain-containing protein [Streptomonospora litoralis]QBI52409.1 hypothetical protein EKD16_02990 [Streptomonospora litoralis]
MADDGRFVPGLELARRFYWEAVAPVLDRHASTPPHSAALIGPGSEVLGFDTERSTDHDWGPRLQVFLADAEQSADSRARRITDLLTAHLPTTFLGYPTNLEPTGEEGIRAMRASDARPRHGVAVVGLGHWLDTRLGFDPRAGTTTLDWLATPTQVLAETIGGAVFHDGLGELKVVRERLSWYPDDVWRYTLACQWQRLSQEEAFPGRCGEVGDELGSAVVAARLVRDLMRLFLLMTRRYPPYSKWLGSAFARLPCAPELSPVLRAALAATGTHERERHLATAYATAAEMHNTLGLTADVDPRIRRYHDRPYRVLHAERFALALRESIADTTLRAFPLVGAVDQAVDGTDVLTHRARTRAVFATLGPEAA